MQIQDILNKIKKPTIYSRGSSFMWTDEHISKQLLAIHLDPKLNLGSRKLTTIQSTVKWILEEVGSNKRLNILDLGCGPGLYTEILAEKGHHVTGVDISSNSIEYAKVSAKEKDLDIRYIASNYLEMDLEEDQYDIILMIYTDFGALSPEERTCILNKIYKALKKNALFIFDVLKDNDLEQKLSPESWDIQAEGFWRNSPYLALSQSYLYEKEKVILFQHHIIDSHEQIETYTFWTHFFSNESLKGIIEDHGFKSYQVRDDILPESDLWNGKNVIFTIAKKH